MHYLTREDILDLHGYVVERFGGRLGLNSNDRLQSLVAAPRQMMFGQELYASLPTKAAALAFALIKNRPFRSGNEATALLAVLRFAEINHYHVADVAQLATELRATACSERDQTTLEAWFEAHMHAA